MKTIPVEVPDGKEAKWVNNVLTLVDKEPKVEFKFKVGDKVTIVSDHPKQVFTIKAMALSKKGDVLCKFVEDTIIEWIPEENLEPYTPKDITVRIKTFEDAMEWCDENNKENLVLAYKEVYGFLGDMADMQDVFAYLKLRIITCALNEGWEPTFEGKEARYSARIFVGETDDEDIELAVSVYGLYGDSSSKLDFKARELANYAATQFRDIYMDFCYKGKE